MVDWKRVREDFPVAKRCAYFISAGMSPMPAPVLARVTAEYRAICEEGDIHWEKDIDRYRATLAKAAARINAGASDLAIVNNTSLAMSLIAMSFARNAGRPFNVVSMVDEFPSTTVPFEYQEIDMRYVKPAGARYPVESIMENVDDDTLAVVTSYVQYATGFRQDLARLGRELKRRGAMLVVNATQGFPLFPIDVEEMNISAMSASLHKWGFAGQIGSLLYTSPEYRRRFPTPIAGWLSVDTGGELIPTAKGGPIKIKGGADQYVFGCINFQALSGLDAALDYLNSIGFHNIQARIMELTDMLIERLKGIGAAIVSPVDCESERSASVAFSMGRDNAGAVAHLERNGVYVSLRGGNIRAAVNFFNDEDDIARLIGCLSSLNS